MFLVLAESAAQLRGGAVVDHGAHIFMGLGRGLDGISRKKSGLGEKSFHLFLCFDENPLL